MTINKGRFTSDNQPATRGKSYKGKVFDVIRENALLDCAPNASNQEVEKAFLLHIVRKAFDNDDKDNSLLLKEMISRLHPPLKAEMDRVEFDFDPKSTIVEKVDQLIEAVSNGLIPPDISVLMIKAIKDGCIVENEFDLKNRVEALEAMING